MDFNLPIIAGSISTVIFGLSTLPMLLKAVKTKDLKSYSLGNILLSNLGNVIHSVYVFNLPPGPIWLLHTFYLVTTCLMLVWYLRYEWRPAFLAKFGDDQQSAADFAHSMRDPSEKYPTNIPHSGHDHTLSILYAGSEAS